MCASHHLHANFEANLRFHFYQIENYWMLLTFELLCFIIFYFEIFNLSLLNLEVWVLNLNLFSYWSIQVVEVYSFQHWSNIIRRESSVNLLCYNPYASGFYCCIEATFNGYYLMLFDFCINSLGLHIEKCSMGKLYFYFW